MDIAKSIPVVCDEITLSISRTVHHETGVEGQ